MPAPYLLQPQPYRSLAVFIAIVGSILLWRYQADQGIAAFAAVLLLFIGALAAIVTVVLALRQRDVAGVIQGVLLMLWQIGFPLLLMSKLYYQAA